MAASCTQSAIVSRERSARGVGRRHGQRGGALLEFVVLFPVLAMLLFGVWEFGRIFDAWLVSTNAAREGARYGVESVLADPDFETYVRGKVRDYVESGYGARLGLGDVHIEDTDIQVERDSTSGSVTVTVAAAIDIWAPAVTPLMGSDTFTVTAWSTMRQ
ncbi:MAG: TadE family protein [Chloroflexota bacterium]